MVSLCLFQSIQISLAIMITAGGTVTSHTGTPIVLVLTSTPNVEISKALPNIAPDLSTRAAVGVLMPALWPASSMGNSIDGGMNSTDRKRTNLRKGYVRAAAARKGSMREEVYVTKVREKAPDRTRFVGLDETRTTEAVLQMNVLEDR